jgi:hypothetical protein
VLRIEFQQRLKRTRLTGGVEKCCDTKPLRSRSAERFGSRPASTGGPPLGG